MRILRVPLLAAVLIAVTWIQPYRNKPSIRLDGVGYHIWTHALLTLDFQFCRLAERAGATGVISARNPRTGICQVGLPARFWAGFAVLAIGVAAYFGRLTPSSSSRMRRDRSPADLHRAGRLPGRLQ